MKNQRRPASCLSIQTHHVRPARPFQRFKPSTVIHSGVDPNGNFLTFLKKDVNKNIDIHRDKKAENNARRPQSAVQMGQVPVGTTTCTYKMGLTTAAKLDRNKLNIS